MNICLIIIQKKKLILLFFFDMIEFMKQVDKEKNIIMRELKKIKDINDINFQWIESLIISKIDKFKRDKDLIDQFIKSNSVSLNINGLLNKPKEITMIHGFSSGGSSITRFEHYCKYIIPRFIDRLFICIIDSSSGNLPNIKNL